MKRFLLLLVMFLVACSLHAQDVKYIQLRQEKVSFVPNGFYISGVVDDREDKGAIGVINSGRNQLNIDMQNGLVASFKSYIDNNVKQDKAAQPVTLHIARLDADVSRQGAEWSAAANAEFIFYIGDTKLLDLSGNSRAVTAADPGAFYEGFIRKAEENDLKKFGEWWERNKGSIATSSSVRVNASVGKTNDKPGSIIYSLDRPLQIADFQGPVEGSEYEMAITASGIGVSYSEQTENGQIVIDMTVTPYFNKAKSWFKKEGRNSNVLAHEQTHFDITGIKACELAATIRKTAFTKESYKQLIEQLQQQNAMESAAEEAKYDAETNHGIITDKQLEWQKKITEQVKAAGCY
jgi:hypothetical protein